MARARRLSAFVRRRIQKPVVTVVAIGVLAIEAAMLPGYPEFSRAGLWLRYSAPTPWVRAVPTHAGYHARTTVAELFGVRDAGGWRLIDPDAESYDEIGAFLERGDTPVAYITANEHHHRSGVWAITTNETGYSIQVHGVSGPALTPLTPEDEQVLRALVADHISEYPWSRQVRTGDAVTTRLVWSGVAHDAVTILALLTFIVSLGWVPYAPAWIRARLASRALARDRCPACGYAIAGLDRCPECGRPIPSRGGHEGHGGPA